MLQRLKEDILEINDFLWNRNESSLTFLKDKVVALHKKYPPDTDLENMMKFYFANYEPRLSFSTLIEILLYSCPS